MVGMYFGGHQSGGRRPFTREGNYLVLLLVDVKSFSSMSKVCQIITYATEYIYICICIYIYIYNIYIIYYIYICVCVCVCVCVCKQEYGKQLNC